MSDDSGSAEPPDDSVEPDAEVRRAIEELRERIAAEQAGTDAVASGAAAAAVAAPPPTRRRHLGRPATLVVVIALLVALIGLLVTVAINGGASKRPGSTKGTGTTNSTRSTSTTPSTTGLSPTSAPPTRPVTPAPPPGHPRRPGRASPVPLTVRVGAGDNFWTLAAGLAAERLHGFPSDAQIAPVWLALIAANSSRLLVPGNPNLIYPGQVLLVPPF